MKCCVSFKLRNLLSYAQFQVVYRKDETSCDAIVQEVEDTGFEAELQSNTALGAAPVEVRAGFYLSYPEDAGAGVPIHSQEQRSRRASAPPHMQRQAVPLIKPERLMTL